MNAYREGAIGPVYLYIFQVIPRSLYFLSSIAVVHAITAHILKIVFIHVLRPANNLRSFIKTSNSIFRKETLLEGYWKTIVSCFLRTKPLLKYLTTGLK